jgi:MFS transporter, UMF1 family
MLSAASCTHPRAPSVRRVSAAAFAIGYLGGGVLLALSLAVIAKPEWFGFGGADATLSVRLSLAAVAVWWVIFSIPLLRRVPEPPRRLEEDEQPGQNPVRVEVTRLSETFRELRSYKQAFLMLVAFVLYTTASRPFRGWPPRTAPSSASRASR